MRRATSQGVTFAVADVKRAGEPCPAVPYAEALATTIEAKGTLEAYSQNTLSLLSAQSHPFEPSVHAFVTAVNLAYDRHYPLILSPDMIWLLIAQGFAQHVNANAETLRDRLVAHTGSVTLEVRRDQFVRGSAGNNWEGVFSEFSQQIRRHVGTATHDLIVPRFSTTGATAQAAFEVTLLNTMKSYFDYLLITRCGIPEITLEGTPEDWEAIRNGVESLAEFDLDWWAPFLLPVLDQFVTARRGKANRTFWQEFYKLEHGSGGPYINGHIVNLFPYLGPTKPENKPGEPYIAEMQRTSGMTRDQIEAFYARMVEVGVFPEEGDRTLYRTPYLGGKPRGMTSRELSSGIACTPFIWDYLGTKLPMEFATGFVGVSQNAHTLALRPEIGWAIRDCKP